METKLGYNFVSFKTIDIQIVIYVIKNVKPLETAFRRWETAGKRWGYSYRPIYKFIIMVGYDRPAGEKKSNFPINMPYCVVVGLDRIGAGSNT